ncbi:MAG: hypothetical protein Q8R00_04445 [Candidatus Nanoarchaeia archaeon]|nr:hypothetical protein [Candidatus Nanoarchaeia archaeon]
MGVIQQVTKDFFLKMVPYLSIGIVLVMLEFFFEHIYNLFDKLLSRPIRNFMQRNMRKVLHALPNFDSFLTFLITLLVVIPFLAVLINDIFSPFLRSLANNFWIMIISPIILLVVVYMSFENWYKYNFKVRR